jgi:mycothiol synthase
MTTQISGLTIRPFTNTDYEALGRLWNATFTEFTATKEELQFDDQHRPAKCLHRRWVAERDGRTVAFAMYDQMMHIYHPRKFTVDVLVEHAYQLQGIGRALYDQIVDALRQFDPLMIDSWTRDDMRCRVRFLESRGFSENMRMWASELDLTTFDPTPFESYRREVEAQGIQIKSLAELADDPRRDRKVYDTWKEVSDDVPIPPGEVRQEFSLEQWLEHQQRPSLLEDGYFMAVDNDRYVGTSALWLAPDADLLKTGLTGVIRSHRRRGIALALKLHALDFARSSGYRRVVTDNESGNRPMLAINERLGFKKHPAWVRYVADWQRLAGSHR